MGATSIGHGSSRKYSDINIQKSKKRKYNSADEELSGATPRHHKRKQERNEGPSIEAPATSAQTRVPEAGQVHGSVQPDWFNDMNRPTDHIQAMDMLRRAPPDQQSSIMRRHKRLLEKPVELLEKPGGLEWPMDASEPSPFPPPWPSHKVRKLMHEESDARGPEAPPGPYAQMWLNDLTAWYYKLQRYFNFDPANLADNVYRSRHRWRARLSYLEHTEPTRFQRIMDDIEVGHKIPFDRQPKRYFRRANPPSLAKDKNRAWAAIMKDIAHGAIRPVDIAAEGVPTCVCPVRTADKSDGTARFVHNSRRVNKLIPKSQSACELESVLKTRNIYIPGGYAIGSDFASGYHCLRMHPKHRKYLAFALDPSELTEEAKKWLHDNYPGSFHERRGCFVFVYVALPFGLSSSCRAFNDLISALVGFWRRCSIGAKPVRASSYIDDIVSVQKTFTDSMRMAIRMIFEAASLGLLFRIHKCSFCPSKTIKTLGTIVNLESFTFSVSRSRVEKIHNAIQALKSAVRANWRAVPAKLVASFIGLIWSIAPCCHRAASVMLRSVTDVLATTMRIKLSSLRMPLKVILNMFWAGTVSWSHEAQRQLEFWCKVDFASLRAHISADVLGRSVELLFEYPANFDCQAVSFLAQDASETASGGGLILPTWEGLRFQEQLFLAEFGRDMVGSSSTLRELLGIVWCIRATAHITRSKLVFLCDNRSACQAILRGSAKRPIQKLAEEIFLWCLHHGKTCWPVWVPRDHYLIQEADRRSRYAIPHDDRSPRYVVWAANRMAWEAWREPLSFDQAASHLSAVRVHGHQLPFNAYCMQPGASGVDTFRQWGSWEDNVNFVYPPKPMTGRLVTFLPATNARSVVVFPKPVPSAWWSYAIQPSADGVLMSAECGDFIIITFDFRTPGLDAYLGPSRPN